MDSKFKDSNLLLKADSKMADIVFSHPHLMLMLEHFGIEFPVQEKTMQELCLENNINIELFQTFASLYIDTSSLPVTSFSFTDINTIVNYLKNSHRYYLDEIYPAILNVIQEMAKVNNLKGMLLVEEFFMEYFKEVKEHLYYENNIVFPYILKLNQQINNGKATDWQTNYSVEEYKEQHDDIKEILHDLKSLLIKYLPQEKDQPLRRKLLLSLFELEYDLNIHTQIEDLILIPIVSRMESYIKKSK